jgi:hypothetical protein
VNLEIFIASGNKISDSGIEHVSCLELSMCELNRACVSCLELLTELDCCGSSLLSDVGVSKICSSKTLQNLKKVSLSKKIA